MTRPDNPNKHEARTGNLDQWRSRWLIPLVPVALGAVILVAAAITGHILSGVAWFVVLSAISALSRVAGRFEAARRARRHGEDEREAIIDTRDVDHRQSPRHHAHRLCRLHARARAEHQPIHRAPGRRRNLLHDHVPGVAIPTLVRTAALPASRTGNTRSRTAAGFDAPRGLLAASSSVLHITNLETRRVVHLRAAICRPARSQSHSPSRRQLEPSDLFRDRRIPEPGARPARCWIESCGSRPNRYDVRAVLELAPVPPLATRRHSPSRARIRRVSVMQRPRRGGGAPRRGARRCGPNQADSCAASR